MRWRTGSRQQRRAAASQARRPRTRTQRCSTCSAALTYTSGAFQLMATSLVA